MVTKVKWKRIETWKDYYPSVTWAKSRNNWVRVWKTGLPLREMKRRGHAGTFIVNIKGKKTYFKTKTEALVFAKNYMKKH